MKTLKIKNIRFFLAASLGLGILSFYTNCSQMVGLQSGTASSSSLGPASVGAGTRTPGVGAATVPTGQAVAARIQNALQNHVTVGAGNFAASYLQVKNNLPQTTDPTQATGFDQVQLLAYAACSDLTTTSKTQTTSLMQSVYNVNPSMTIAQNTPALMAAGMSMLNQYTANLASTSAASTQINSALTTLLGSMAGNSSTIAFMSVCIAANSAGATLLGF